LTKLEGKEKALVPANHLHWGSITGRPKQNGLAQHAHEQLDSGKNTHLHLQQDLDRAGLDILPDIRQQGQVVIERQRNIGRKRGGLGCSFLSSEELASV
jgi:hypothetical protein